MRLPRRSYALIALVAFAAAPSISEAAQRSRAKWWQSERFRQELGLTDEQSKHIEEIYQSNLPELRVAKDKLDALQRDLSAVLSGDASEAQVAQQVDRVEAARSTLGKLRTLMLFRMHKVLTPQQRATLKSIHERHDRGDSDRKHF